MNRHSMKTLALNALVSVSQQIGASRAYVQGGGGNTSIQYHPDVMLIKASGTRLADMTTDNGYSIIRTNTIRSLIEQGITDARLHQAITQSVCPSSPNPIPSIETSLHVLLGRCVIHCHSIYANVLNCSYEGEAITRQLFPEALIIPYTTVGPALASALYERLPSPQTPWIFLQNHGLIVQAEDMQQAHHYHTLAQQRIQLYLGITAEPSALAINDDISQDILFPDQLIYLQKPSSQAFQETRWAFSCIRHIQQQQRLTPRFLSIPAQQALRTLEGETHRQAVAI